jgi:ubiquinol-cytochrome c reductase cytochrome b subunit
VLLSCATALGLVSVLGDRRDTSVRRDLAAAIKQATWARALALKGVPPAGGEAVFDNDPAARSRRLFAEHCAHCHAIDGVGADKAPDFAGYGSRAWVSAVIRDARSTRFYGGTKHTTEMDPFPPSKLPDPELAAVVEYVVALAEDPSLGPIDRGLAKRGEALFDEHDCTTCHETDGSMGNDGPNLRHRGTPTWVVSVIADPSQPRLFGENARMPKFGDKLDPAQIDQLASFVVGQRGQFSAPIR